MLSASCGGITRVSAPLLAQVLAGLGIGERPPFRIFRAPGADCGTAVASDRSGGSAGPAERAA